jgi:hypothetical protein
MIEQATVLDSRRLLGPSRLMDAAGALLEVEFDASQSEQLISGWADGLRLMFDALGWMPATPRVLPRRGGASLGFEALPTFSSPRPKSTNGPGRTPWNSRAARCRVARSRTGADQPACW